MSSLPYQFGHRKTRHEWMNVRRWGFNQSGGKSELRFSSVTKSKSVLVRTKFEVNGVRSLSSNARKLFHKSERPRNAGNLVKRNQKLIRPGEYHNEFVRQIWTQPKKQFSCRWTETARQIRGQEMMGIHQHVFKSVSGLGSPIRSSSTKFELKLISGLAANAWKPQKCNELTNGEAIPMSPSNSVEGGQLTLYVLDFSEGT